MKSLNLKLALPLLLSAVLLTFTSCEKKEKDEEVTLEQLKTVSSDVSIAEKASSDAFRKVDEESRSAENDGGFGKTGGIFSWTSSMDTCAVITLNTNGGNFPMTLSIDFGTGCTDAYGITRKGKVTGVYSGFYSEPGTTVDVSFDNYYVQGYKIEGTKTITNDGRVNGDLNFTAVDDNVITKPDGGQVTWNSTRTNIWYAGESTTFWPCDDEYSITGTATGEASDGTPYGMDVDASDPLIYEVCCPYVTAGTLTYSIAGNDVATVDYSTGGGCDATVTINWNGNDYVYTVL